MKKLTIKQFKDILNQSESDHLDFKKDYSTNADLIEDILALANSRSSQKYRFLVIGITDNRKIIGVEASNRRKCQREIVDILRNAMINEMPTFKHYTLKYEDHDIDILQIEKTPGKLYFLKQKYKDSKSGKDIHEGTLLIRCNDTNRKIVDENVLMDIFREKIGIDKSPLERACIYLKNPDRWECGLDDKNCKYFYYKEFPEFTVQIHDSDSFDPFHDPWATNFPSKEAYKQILFLKYHNTILGRFVGVLSDGARYLTVCPESFYYEDVKSGVTYLAFYYIKDSIQLLLNDMIQIYFPKEARGQRIIFPVFSSKQQAEKMFKQNWTKYTHFILKENKWFSINFKKMIKFR